MLRRVENVSVQTRTDLRGLLSGSLPVVLQVGRRTVPVGRLPKAAPAQWEARSLDEPVCWGRDGQRAWSCYQERWYVDNEGLSAAQVQGVLDARRLRHDDSVKQAMAIAEHGRLPASPPRGRIHPDVRAFVLRRDGDRCVACGSTHELQLDHRLPVAFGGPSTPDNLQVLCGPCNRRKGVSSDLPLAAPDPAPLGGRVVPAGPRRPDGPAGPAVHRAGPRRGVPTLVRALVPIAVLVSAPHWLPPVAHQVGAVMGSRIADFVQVPTPAPTPTVRR